MSDSTLAPVLTIIIPVFNEERTLAELIGRVIKHCPEAQIIYVDDGSVDSSTVIIHDHLRAQDRFLKQVNAGKGSAIRKAIPYATGQYTIIQDADLEYDPSDISLLLHKAQAHSLDAVFGSRRLKDNCQYAHLSYYLGGVAITWIFNVLYWAHLTDLPTCYKLVRTELLRSLQLSENDFRFDAELCCDLRLRGVSISECPISYSPRSLSAGKKIRWFDGAKYLFVFFKKRFSYQS